MEEREIKRKIYVAEDGKEFLTKEECEKHEKFAREVLSKIAYFTVFCQPDLTETGTFQHKIYVAVLSDHYQQKAIATEWCIRKFGYLGESVQGYGFQPHFALNDSNEEEYKECAPLKWAGWSNHESERIFLSPKAVDGFPENIDYMKEWGFK